MCGIVCKSGVSVSTEQFLDSLKRLEYRGYDSIGVSLIHEDDIQIAKSTDSVDSFISSAKQSLVPCFKVGIGHTRWATHGIASLENAHPIIVNGIAVVHNGIISNIEELKNRFCFRYSGETDTEFIVRYIDYGLSKKLSLEQIIFSLIEIINGESAFIAISRRFGGISVAVAKDSSLVFSIKNGDLLIGSDTSAIAPIDRYHRLNNSILFFKNGIFNDEPILKNYSFDKKRLGVNWIATASTLESRSLGEYSSFFKKEIEEQPEAIVKTAASFKKKEKIARNLVEKSESIVLYGSGSAYNAALWGSYLLRSLGKNAVAIPASEAQSYSSIRYDLSVAISQSGETMDTIKANKVLISDSSLSLVNREESSLTHMTDVNLYLDVGEEISVASSKTFMAQIVMTYLLCGGSTEEIKDAVKTVKEAIAIDIDDNLMQAKLYLFVGRNSTYPIALEGALKLKELSYIPSDGLPSGELKHGPISLIDRSVVVVALEPIEESEKFKGIIEEVKARGGRILELNNAVRTTTEISRTLAYTALIQNLARKCAKFLGRNIDKPRNLAKSVTVV